jgi:hypothetical protein
VKTLAFAVLVAVTASAASAAMSPTSIQPPVSRGAPFPITVYDLDGRERVTYVIDRAAGGYVHGVDVRTGAQWRADIAPSGVITGADLDGNAWRYDPKSRTYTNLTTGRSCRSTSLRHVCAPASTSSPLRPL